MIRQSETMEFVDGSGCVRVGPISHERSSRASEVTQVSGVETSPFVLDFGYPLARDTSRQCLVAKLLPRVSDTNSFPGN